MLHIRVTFSGGVYLFTYVLDIDQFCYMFDLDNVINIVLVKLCQVNKCYKLSVHV